MMDTDNPICAVDIGNSRIKLLTGGVFFACEYRKGWQKKTVRFLSNNFSNKPVTLAISSVNDKRKDELINYLKNYYILLEANQGIQSISAFEGNLPLIIIEGNDLLKAQTKIDFSGISGIGSDRIFGLLGAITDAKPPLITIDCGTAITINALGMDYNCLGGAILPGVYTQLDSMSRKAEKLKKINLTNPKSSTGKNTEDAFRIGIIKGTAGAVSHIIHEIWRKEFNKNDVKIFLTGGCSSLIIPPISEILSENQEMKIEIFVRENLNLTGILSIALLPTVS